MDTNKLKELANLDLSNFTPPSENNVKYNIVIPFLKSFHYKELMLEHAAQGSRIDINIDNQIIVETKALGQTLDNHVRQLAEYCGREFPVLAILTNGRGFRIYSPQWRHKRLFADKIIYKFELSDLENEELVKHLDLILGFKNFESREYLDNIDKREKELLNIAQKIEEYKKLELNTQRDIEHVISEIKSEIQELRDKLESKEQERKYVIHNQDPKITKLIKEYFVPEIESQNPNHSSTLKPNKHFKSNDFVPGEALILINEKKGINAYGNYLENGKFVVYMGSTITNKPAPKFETSNPSGFILLKEYIEDGTIDENRTFTKDVSFNSISSAAGIIIGNSANGKVLWRKK